MCPAASWTDQPSHQDGVAHCSADNEARVSVMAIRSPWMYFQVSADCMAGPPSRKHPLHFIADQPRSAGSYRADRAGGPGSGVVPGGGAAGPCSGKDQVHVTEFVPTVA